MVIKVELSESSIDNAIQQLNRYKKNIEKAGEEIARKLANIGYDVAYSIIAQHVFSGETLESLLVTKKGEGKYVISAGSVALLFFEFGAGVREGYGHPWASELGLGPGTYPGNGHWDDPNGWWFPTDDKRLIVHYDKQGQGWGHSYGNQPHMPFYRAAKQIENDLLRVAKEVLRSYD